MRKLATNKDKLKQLIRIFVGLMCVAAFISFVAGCKNAIVYPTGSIDFQYDSAKIFSMRINPYKETLNPTEASESLELDMFYSHLEANQFPSMIMLLLPYCLLSPMAANWAWMFSNILFTIGIIILIKILFFDKCYKEFCRNVSIISEKDDKLVYSFFVALFIIGLPWRNNIGNGQHTLMACFFFLLSIYFFETKRNTLSGIALAVSFFKYTLTVPLSLYFIYKKKYKSFVIALGIHIVLTFIAALWLNASVMEMIIEPLKIASKFTASGAYDLGAFFGLGKIGIIVAIISMVAVFILLISGKIGGDDEEVFSLLVMFSLIIVYHMVYDYFILLIPLVVFTLKRDNQQTVVPRVLLWLFTMYIFIILKIIITIGVPSAIIHIIDKAFTVLFYGTIVLLFMAVNKHKTL